jgi:hypothetical protein
MGNTQQKQPHFTLREYKTEYYSGDTIILDVDGAIPKSARFYAHHDSTDTNHQWKYTCISDTEYHIHIRTVHLGAFQLNYYAGYFGANPQGTLNIKVIRAPLPPEAITLTTDRTLYEIHGTITVSWYISPWYKYLACPKSWIAIAPKGVSATQFGSWQYTGDTMVGSLNFKVPRCFKPYNKFEFRYFGYGQEDWYTPCTSTHFDVFCEASELPMLLTIDKEVVYSDESFTVTWDATKVRNELQENTWIGMFAESCPSKSYKIWAYTQDQVSGSMQFILDNDKATGPHEVRFFGDRSCGLCLCAIPFTANSRNGIDLSVEPLKVPERSIVRVSWDRRNFTCGLQEDEQFWIGLFPKDMLCSDCKFIKVVDQVAGTVEFDLRRATEVGEWEARFFCGDFDKASPHAVASFKIVKTFVEKLYKTNAYRDVDFYFDNETTQLGHYYNDEIIAECTQEIAKGKKRSSIDLQTSQNKKRKN